MKEKNLGRELTTHKYFFVTPAGRRGPKPFSPLTFIQIPMPQVILRLHVPWHSSLARRYVDDFSFLASDTSQLFVDWTVFLTANQIVVRRDLVNEETFY